MLQISQNAVRYHGALEPILVATLALARAAGSRPWSTSITPPTPDLVRDAVELGVTSVMFDASALPYEENVAATAAMARVLP